MSKVNSNSEIVTVINTLKELDTQKKKNVLFRANMRIYLTIEIREWKH